MKTQVTLNSEEGSRTASFASSFSCYLQIPYLEWNLLESRPFWRSRGSVLSLGESEILCSAEYDCEWKTETVRFCWPALGQTSWFQVSACYQLHQELSVLRVLKAECAEGPLGGKVFSCHLGQRRNCSSHFSKKASVETVWQKGKLYGSHGDRECLKHFNSLWRSGTPPPVSNGV